MKQTNKAKQLRLVRMVVRELSSEDLSGVNGGAVSNTCRPTGGGNGCVAPSCYLNTGTPPVACGSATF